MTDSPFTRPRIALATGAVLLAVAGCGGTSTSGRSATGTPAAKVTATSTPEVNTAGDIPDNQAYVAYALPGAGVSVKVPEGWSRSSAGGAVTFTDKLNSIRIEAVPAQAPLTVRDARQTELPKLSASVRGYTPGAVSSVTRKAGTVIRMTYLATSPANPVTGKVDTDAVERYVFFHKGKDLILTLTGPKSADNVDPWKIVTDSVRWTA